MGKFSTPQGEQPIRVPPDTKTGKPTIGAQKAAASEKSSALARNRKIILISICSVTAVLLIGIIASIWYFVGWPTDDGLILNNVMVSGINLGGMTRDQAEAALHQATDHTFTQTDMVVELPNTTLHFSPSRTGAKLDVEAVVDDAYKYGRMGNYKEREAAKEASLTTTHHIPLLNYLNLDLTYIRSELDAYGESYNSTYLPSSVTFDIDAPVLDASDEHFQKDAPCQVMTLTIGMPGRRLDIDDVYNRVLDAYSFNTFLVKAEPAEPETLPEVLDLEAMYKEYRKDPVSAYVDMKTFEVVPEIYGYDFNLEQALQQLEQADYGDTIEVPFRYLLPEVYGDELSKKLFRDVLGAYETKHSGDENRNNNLRLACATYLTSTRWSASAPQLPVIRPQMRTTAVKPSKPWAEASVRCPLPCTTAPWSQICKSSSAAPTAMFLPICPWAWMQPSAGAVLISPSKTTPISQFGLKRRWKAVLSKSS